MSQDFSGHIMRVTLYHDVIEMEPECHESDDADCRADSIPGNINCVVTDDLTTEGTKTVMERCSSYFAILLSDGMSILVERDGDCYIWRPEGEIL